MIVDTSALVAILRQEEDGAEFADILARTGPLFMSAASYLELCIVIDGDRNPTVSDAVDALIGAAGIDITPVTAEQARLAREAYRRYGRGSGHAAKLNFGDCFAYALAKDRDMPLLFKGDDFSRTDVRRISYA